MKVSIIILNYNGKEYLKHCIPSIQNQSFKDFEIILFDNDSSDDSVVYITENYPEVRVISNNQNFGFAEGCNEAYKYTKGEYIILLNNDTIIDKYWLKHLVNAMDKCDISTSKILKIRNPLIIDSVGLIFKSDAIFPCCRGTGEIDTGQYDKEEYVWGSSGCSMMIKRSLIEEIGFFDASYFAYCEDVDFCWRANNAGYKTLYVPESIVYHYGGGTSKKGFKITYLIETNKAKTIKKHGSTLLKIRFIINETSTMIKSTIGHLLNRNNIGYKPYLNAIKEMIK